MYGYLHLVDGPKEWGFMMSRMKEEILTTCPRDCYDACGIVDVKEQGEIVRVKGDPGHPFSEGSLCSKCTIAYNRAW